MAPAFHAFCGVVSRYKKSPEEIEVRLKRFILRSGMLFPDIALATGRCKWQL
jgi:hypothetical protein